jgi:hypothetical protein
VLAQAFVAASALIILTLGVVHLAFTFFTRKFSPRDPDLEMRLKAVSPVITRQTTMWRAWVGFNASHSFGAMLFGAVYGYLALLHADFLFQSRFLGLVGLAMLLGYLALGKLYWFSVPFRGIALACVAYVVGFIIALA